MEELETIYQDDHLLHETFTRVLEQMEMVFDRGCLETTFIIEES